MNPANEQPTAEPNAPEANKEQQLKVAIIRMGESFSGRWLDGWDALLGAWGNLYDVRLVRSYATEVCMARASAAEQALKTSADYILWLDDDNPPNPAGASQLLADVQHPDIALAAGWYGCETQAGVELSFGRAYNVIGSQKKRRRPADLHDFLLPEIGDIQEIDWTGFGCVMMKRTLLEAVGPEAFLPIAEGDAEDGWQQKFIWDDWSFCRRAKEKGFRLFVDRRVKVPHLKLRDINAELG